MNRELLSKAFGDIDERFVAQAVRPVPGDAAVSLERAAHRKKKRVWIIALAAALALALGGAAYAAGWLTPIFHTIRYVVPDPEDRKPGREDYYAQMEEKNAVMEAAEQYMNQRRPTPETVYLPELDHCEITLSERYYNGETLVLGIHLETDVPEFAAVYDREEEIREKANHIAFFTEYDGNDDLDAMLAAGLPRNTYEDIMASTTDRAREHGLRHASAIVLDSMLVHALTPEEYDAAWEHLLETGYLCVVRNNLYVSDHIRMEDGTDLGQTYGMPVSGDDLSVRTRDTFIEAPELPEAARGLDSLTFQLNVRIVRIYYYMELDGPVREYAEPAGEALVPFCVENAEA